MEIITKAVGSVLLTNEVRSFTEDKLHKLEKLLDASDTGILAEMELSSVNQSRSGDLFRAELNLTFAGGFVRAEAARETLHAAIDEVVDEAKREIKKVRTKHRDLVRRGAAQVKEFFRRFRGQ